MTKVRHVGEGSAVPGLVLAGMKAFPIARKFAALSMKILSSLTGRRSDSVPGHRRRCYDCTPGARTLVARPREHVGAPPF